mgnify:CR=1 FL=1
MPSAVRRTSPPGFIVLDIARAFLTKLEMLGFPFSSGQERPGASLDTVRTDDGDAFALTVRRRFRNHNCRGDFVGIGP